jgi:hypothetical protein
MAPAEHERSRGAQPPSHFGAFDFSLGSIITMMLE